MLASSAHRVPNRTPPAVNERIRRSTEMNLAFFAEHPEKIRARLRELDREWDIERVLETTASALTLFGLVRALRRRRIWLLVPLTVQSFFLQHVLQGWSPPVSLLRKLGFRTQWEIDRERYALKALHGDFRRLETEDDGEGCARARAAFEAAER